MTVCVVFTMFCLELRSVNSEYCIVLYCADEDSKSKSSLKHARTLTTEPNCAVACHSRFPEIPRSYYKKAQN